MQHFTVILNYPDYASDSRTESYLDYVEAEDAPEAITKARAAAMKANTDEQGECSIEDADDFAVVYVFLGYSPIAKGW